MLLAYSEKNKLFKVPPIVQTLDGVHAVTTTLIAISSTVVDIIGVVEERVKVTVGGLGMVGGARAFFVLPNLINNSAKAIRTNHLVVRIKNVARVILDAGALWAAAHEVLWGLKHVGVLAQEAITWTQVVNQALFPLQFVSLGIDLHDAAETESLKRQITTQKNHRTFCEFVVEHHRAIRKKLSLSKASRIDKKAQAILETFSESPKKAKMEAEQFRRVFEKRVSKRLALDLLNVVVKVVAVVSVAIMLFMPPNPAVWIVAGVSGVLTASITVLDLLLMSEDPFAKQQDLIYRIRKPVKKVFNECIIALERFRVAYR